MREEQLNLFVRIAEDYIWRSAPLQDEYFPNVYVKMNEVSGILQLVIACLDEERVGYVFTFELAKNILLEEDQPEKYAPNSTFVPDHVRAFELHVKHLQEIYAHNWKVTQKRVHSLREAGFHSKSNARTWGHLRVDYGDYLMIALKQDESLNE